MTYHHNWEEHESAGARRVSHEIEHKVAHGHSLKSTLNEEIHKLRQLDSSHGKLNCHQFERDLKAVDQELHNRHLLPHLHIVTDGKHLGELVSDSRQSHGDHGLQHNSPVPDGKAAGHRQRESKLHAVVPGSGSHSAFDNIEPRQLNDRPPGSLSDAGASQLDTLKSAIERSKAGGRALAIVQIGDSHVKSGVETPALVDRLAADTGLKSGQVGYSFTGDVGKTASYANEHPEEFLRNINQNTDLVIVSFGSNEAGSPVGDKYSNDYASLIQKIRGKAPQAAIVMVGPTDGNYWNSSRHLPYLEEVAAAQQAVAARVPDSSYLKIGPQMGSVASMRQRGLMSSDNLHLTEKGYQLLGSIIADDITEVLRNPRR